MTALYNPFVSSRITNAYEYEPRWDVLSYGQLETDTIRLALERERANPEPSGERRIIVLRAPSGYGKSHLFSRVQHQFGNQSQLIYVPMTNDPYAVSVGDHIRWKIVESLFENRRDFSALSFLLSRLLQRSFQRYFAQLQPDVQRRANPIWNELDAEPLSVLSIFPHIHDLAPYHHLANSIGQQFPELSLSVIRALILTLSPAASDVRTWLRGEAACLSSERQKELLLTDRAPDARILLNTIATLFQKIGKVVIICLDQLELLFRHGRETVGNFVSLLMAWLQDIPNLVISLGCLPDQWQKTFENDSHEQFIRRTQVISLSHLNADQAVELIRRRIPCWSGRNETTPALGPFDEQSIRTYAIEGLRASGLLDSCSRAFQNWLDGGRTNVIHLPEGVERPDFLKIWTTRLEGIRAANKPVDDYQEAEIFEGFQRLIEVNAFGEIVVRVVKETTLGNRPSLALKLKTAGGSKNIIVTFSKSDGGKAFSDWVKALQKAMETHHVAGVVAIWPKNRLSVRSGAGLQNYQNLINSRELRPYDLESNRDVFHQVMTLREALLDAESGQFLFGGRALNRNELIAQIRESKVLDGMNFYEFILNEWCQAEGRLEQFPPPPSPSTANPITISTKLSEITTSISNQGKSPAVLVQEPGRATQEPSKIKPETIVEVPPTGDFENEMKHLVQFLVKKKQQVIADGVESGPTFIRFRVRLEASADVGKIQKQAKNLQTQLSLDREPIIENHAGYVSIDVQRKDRQTVTFSSVIHERPANSEGSGVFPAGKDVGGKVTWIDLAEPSTCHLLVAGITGSGKSEFLKNILASLAASHDPSRVRFALIDPKRVTFNIPGTSPYLLQPVINDVEGTIEVLEKCFNEMNSRYQILQKHNKTKVEELPESIRPARWVIVLDEFANLMDDKSTKKQLETKLKALASMARASGIHLILGTQRPEASVVTTVLRSNLPCRISFQVATGKDSNIVIDHKGAENLLGKGDFLLKRSAGLDRLQSPFVSPTEFEKYLRVNGN